MKLSPELKKGVDDLDLQVSVTVELKILINGFDTV